MQQEFRLRTSPNVQAKAHHLGCITPRITQWQQVLGLDSLTPDQRTTAHEMWAHTRRQLQTSHSEPLLDPVVRDPSDPRCGLDFFLNVSWLDIQGGPSTVTTVPHRSLNAVGELLKSLLQQWREHFDAGGHIQAECAIKAFCALPRLLFANRVKPRTRGPNSEADPDGKLTTPLHTKLALANEARWRELWKFHENAAPGGTSRPMTL